MIADHGFHDWQAAPNIAGNPATYELENEALRRDGRLDRALHSIAPWDSRVLLDIGCGTGFWLPEYAAQAKQVIGVEPDRQLLELATRRTQSAPLPQAPLPQVPLPQVPLPHVEVRYGSAEQLPVEDRSIDIAHARFAYFFGAGADRGLAEVARVLKPDGVFLAIDNSWSGGDFARLLHASSVGNAAIDPGETQQWWAEQGANRHEVEGGWAARTSDELERILRVEFPSDVVTDFMEHHRGPSLTYRFAVYEWRPD